MANNKIPADKSIVLFSTSNEIDLGRAEEHLKSNNIPCMTRNASLQDLFGVGKMGPGYSTITGNHDLLVLEKDAEAARSLLDQLLPGCFTPLKNLPEQEAPLTKEEPREENLSAEMPSEIENIPVPMREQSPEEIRAARIGSVCLFTFLLIICLKVFITLPAIITIISLIPAAGVIASNIYRRTKGTNPKADFIIMAGVLLFSWGITIFFDEMGNIERTIYYRVYNNNQENAPAAIEELQKILTTGSFLIPSFRAVKIEMSLCRLYNLTQQFSRAIEAAENALSMAGENNELRMSILANLGQTSLNARQYQKSVSYYEKGLSIAQRLEWHNTRKNFLHELDELYREGLEQPEKALEYAEKSLEYSTNLKGRDREGELDAHIAIYKNRMAQKNYPAAFTALEDSMEVLKKIKELNKHLVKFYSYYKAYSNNALIQQGIENSQKILALYEKKNPEVACLLFYSLSLAYAELPQPDTNTDSGYNLVDKSYEYLQKSVKLAEGLKSGDWIEEIFDYRADRYGFTLNIDTPLPLFEY